jgi:2-polyprenyl-3-methyl-5-hydroxy-6-metoxy-1,4-benzoquinol methylase
MIYEILRKELTPKKLLLDAGCWVGVYSMLLSSHVRVIGIDVSRIYITNAKKWCHEEGKRSVIDFIICDIEHLPFRRGIFDLLICSETLEHLKHIGRGLTELVRALKTGGKAVISMPNRFSLYYIFQRFFPIVHGRKLSLYSASLNPHLRFDFSRIRKMILDARLEIMATQSVMIIPLNPTRLFYETVVGAMTHIERKLNKTPLRNLGASYILKVQKPSSTHG